ncbi:MAG TPA: metalloregulator ArsR/SmtB family transcription factor [Candidatus Dormibacteraeota bacterium]|jgi:DNA-binding transcriptional ArsR family regulator
MPFEAGGDRGRPGGRIEVVPSAVLELTWILYMLEWNHELAGDEALRAAAPALRDELTALWGSDDDDCLADVSILAERIGALHSGEADTFLNGLERAATLGGVGLELRSETPAVREATIARLERLRREPEVARRYAGILRRAWDVVRPTWEETGRQTVLRTCREWTERLSQGARVVDMLTPKHVLRRSEQGMLLTLRPRVVLSPMYFASSGGSVIDMTSYLHVGGAARPLDEEQARREDCEKIATRMKVLADATRVGLLRALAHEPASVMDLARRFRLAQPTVSNHVRLLRDAGLLDSRKDGPRIVYSVPREQLGRLLDETRDLLLEP